jgi:hypothetical protein
MELLAVALWYFLFGSDYLQLKQEEINLLKQQKDLTAQNLVL